VRRSLKEIWEEGRRPEEVEEVGRQIPGGQPGTRE
jgi:hypothetical protein